MQAQLLTFLDAHCECHDGWLEQIKIWTCGGSMELLPCSRVSHVFRRASPYTFPKSSQFTVSYNLIRLVNVWMAEYKTFFFQMNPGSTYLITSLI